MSKSLVVKCPSCGQHIMVKSSPSGLFYLACPFFECDFPFYVIGPSIDVVVSAWNEAALAYAHSVERPETVSLADLFGIWGDA